MRLFKVAMVLAILTAFSCSSKKTPELLAEPTFQQQWEQMERERDDNLLSLAHKSVSDQKEKLAEIWVACLAENSKDCQHAYDLEELKLIELQLAYATVWNQLRATPRKYELYYAYCYFDKFKGDLKGFLASLDGVNYIQDQELGVIIVGQGTQAEMQHEVAIVLQELYREKKILDIEAFLMKTSLRGHDLAGIHYKLLLSPSTPYMALKQQDANGKYENIGNLIFVYSEQWQNRPEHKFVCTSSSIAEFVCLFRAMAE